MALNLDKGLGKRAGLLSVEFETKEFKKWANENVVLLTVDFPRKKKLPQIN